MNRLRFLIAGLFAIALVTGIVVGMGFSRAVPKQRDRGSWLAEELNLTDKQSEEMKSIWSDISRGQGNFERRRQLQREREDAIQALLTEEQKNDFTKIDTKYKDQVAELNHEREQAFQNAVESTKAILTEAQRAKYDELMKTGFRGGPRDRGDRGDRGDGRRGPPTRRGGTTLESSPSPATAPVEPPKP